MSASGPLARHTCFCTPLLGVNQGARPSWWVLGLASWPLGCLQVSEDAQLIVIPQFPEVWVQRPFIQMGFSGGLPQRRPLQAPTQHARKNKATP